MLRATGRACKTRPPGPFFLGPARPKPGSKSPETRGLFRAFFSEKNTIFWDHTLHNFPYHHGIRTLKITFYLIQDFVFDPSLYDLYTDKACWVKKMLIITINKHSYRYLEIFYCIFSNKLYLLCNTCSNSANSNNLDLCIFLLILTSTKMD